MGKIKTKHYLIFVLIAVLSIAITASHAKGIKITKTLLPYNQNLEKRAAVSIDMIVVHCTETSDLKEARTLGEKIHYQKSRTGNSGHYYIDRDGKIYQYVDDNRIAHHVRGYNSKSFGIEIVNSGRSPNWFHSKKQVPSEKYTAAQIKATKALIKYLQKKYPQISKLKRHSDLDTRMIPSKDNPAVKIRRKIDPGPLFPWKELVKSFNGLLDKR